jgi:REP element-mobilizing transposase RayT
VRTPCLFYRRKLPHLQRDDKPHFITFVTHRRAILPGWARDIALASCIHDHAKCYQLHAAVVMPEHVRLILTPLIDSRRQQVYALPEILDVIKGASSHMINKRQSSRGPVWQHESFDHVLRSSESLDQKIQHVMENPVRRGLAADSTGYPWLWCCPATSHCSLPG